MLYKENKNDGIRKETYIDDIRFVFESEGDHWVLIECSWTTGKNKDAIRIPDYIDGRPVKTITDSTFYNKNFKSVYIPQTIAHIGQYTFCGCDELESINVADNNPNYSSVNGVLFSSDKIQLKFYPKNKVCPIYSVPEETRIIEAGAFEDINIDVLRLTNVVIIDGGAFSHSCITNIEFSNCIDVLNEGSFCGSEIHSIVFEIPPSSSYIVSPFKGCNINNIIFGKEDWCVPDSDFANNLIKSKISF